jgi:hypothetical protein
LTRESTNATIAVRAIPVVYLRNGVYMVAYYEIIEEGDQHATARLSCDGCDVVIYTQSWLGIRPFGDVHKNCKPRKDQVV